VNCSVNSSDASTSTVLISSDESNKFMILSKFPPSIISSITMMVVMMNDFALTLDKYVCQKVVLNLFILTTHLRNEDIVQWSIHHLELFEVVDLDDFIVNIFGIFLFFYFNDIFVSLLLHPKHAGKIF